MACKEVKLTAKKEAVLNRKKPETLETSKNKLDIISHWTTLFSDGELLHHVLRKPEF